METNLKIGKAEICESDIKYRNLIGALLYMGTFARNQPAGTRDAFFLQKNALFKSFVIVF